MDQVLLQDDPDPNQAYPIIDQRTSVINQIDRLEVDTAAAGAAILTQQQKTQLRQIYDGEEAMIDSTPYFGLG